MQHSARPENTHGAETPKPHNVVLIGADIADGLGSPLRQAELAIADGVIVEADAAGSDWPRIDLTGLVLAPGFVDLHTHSDLTVLSSGLAHSAVRQGVTTQVVGNCGLGLAPQTLPDGSAGAVGPDELRAVNSYLDHDPAVATTWPRLSDQLQSWRQAGLSINLATLAAHIPLHAAAAGLADVAASSAQIEIMAELARQALGDGAVGLSTGLVYAPLCFASHAELTALGRVAAERGVMFAWHIRDYIDDLVPSVNQALRVARDTGCRLQISHLQSVGERNWPAFETVMELIDQARAEGVDVGFDMYPYLAGNSMLSQIVPSWAQAGGDEGLRATLLHPGTRAQVRTELLAGDGLAFGWHEIVIAAAPDPAVTGRTLARVAQDRGVEPVDAALDLLAAHGTAVIMTTFGRSEAIVMRTLAHPACLVASDGQAVDPDGATGRQLPHPRSYGCYPHFLAPAFRDRVGLDLPEAIRRCTSAPADRVGLTDRGRIAVGLPADLVAFDAAELADRASYTDPQQYPAGIVAVWVNGVPVVEPAESCDFFGDFAGRGRRASIRHTGARSGRVLTH